MGGCILLLFHGQGKSAKSCPTPARQAPLSMRTLQAKNTGVGCHSLLQGIFLTQGSNPGLLHYRQTLPSEPPGDPNGPQTCHVLIQLILTMTLGLASLVAQLVKNPPANAGDARNMGSIPGSGRSPGEGNGNPLHYSCLENSMDRGALWATVYGVRKKSDRT